MSGKKTMTTLFMLIFWGLAFCSTGLARENKQFVPGKDSGFYYTIKKGDTLWSLSEKFYNTQWDWPGLWEMNKDIKNPHWIYPGQIIQIFLKENPNLKPGVENSLGTRENGAPDKIKTHFSFSKMDHIGFIKEKAQPFLGKIIKEKDNHLMMAANDIVYIEPADNDVLMEGKTYQIFTTSKVEEEINHHLFKGVKHRIKAQVKILEHKKNYSIGSIVHAYEPVYKGDLIMEYYQRDSVLTVENNPEPIAARLVCSEDNHLMINNYVIAFIDAGSDRVKPGEIYSILRKNEIKTDVRWPLEPEVPIELENLESGKLIVLHTEDITSTVMILYSEYAIYPNDMIN